jgi:hypothetical protein
MVSSFTGVCRLGKSVVVEDGSKPRWRRRCESQIMGLGSTMTEVGIISGSIFLD